MEMGSSVKKESGVITIEIQIQEAGAAGYQKLSFETERSVPLRRVFLDFCDRLDLVYGTVRFYQGEGQKINEKQTAEECGIEDGDVLDAFYGIIGGGSPPIPS